MAAKIPVQVHIGVVLLALPEASSFYDKMVVTMTDVSGATQTVEIDSCVAPTLDEAGNPHFVANFQDVQSGGDVIIGVQSWNVDGAPLGLLVDHTASIPEVLAPAGTYLAPQSIFVTF